MMTENLDVFFADWGADFVSGAVTFKGILDQPDQVVGEFAVSTEYTLQVKTSDVSSVVEGAQVTGSSVTYKVRRNFKVGDGLMSILTLSKVIP